MDKKIKESIEHEINSNDVHLFMKGTPLFPQCGFSSTVVQILTYLEVPFTTTNVLDDEGIREGIKEFSNWPTIPQLYIKGELMGGCDIIKEMFENGELKEIFGTGTAVVVLPIESFGYQNKDYNIPEIENPFSIKLKKKLNDIQYDRSLDFDDWKLKIT